MQPEETEDRELSAHLYPKFGSFHLCTGNDGATAQLVTPILGYVEHVPNSCKNREWVSTDDSHDLIGIVVRDLNRSSNGLPKYLIT